MTMRAHSMMSASITLLVTLCVTVTAIFSQDALSQLPTIHSDTVEGAVKAKSNVVLRCNTAEPGVAVNWTQNGVVVTTPNELEISFNGSSMTIEGFKANLHKGDWRCASESLVSKKLTLSKAKMRKFSSNAKNVEVNAVQGTSTIIPCKPPHSNPRADTVFERGVTTIDESTGRFSLLSSGDLLISDVRIGDSGIYTCVAINNVLGDKIKAPYNVTLKVQRPSSLAGFPPQFQNWSSGEVIRVKEGNDLMLPCAVNSNPPEEVEWETYPPRGPNNRSSQIGNSKLIENIQSVDSGTYKCVVEYTNSLSPAVQVYVVTVLTYPRVSFRNTEFYAEEGNDMVIKCHVEMGTSAEGIVQWYRDASLLSNDSDLGVKVNRDELTLYNVSQSLAGMYQCLVSNEVGEDTDYMKLYVQKPRPTTTTSTTTPPTTTPAYQPAPDSVTVEQVRRDGVKVSWSINSTVNVLSYIVKAKTGRGDWLVVGQDIPKQAVETEVNNGLTTGKKYKFIVTAVYRQVHEDSQPSSRLKLDPKFGEEETTPTTTPNAAESNTAATLHSSGICSNQCAPSIISSLSNMTRPAGDIVKFTCGGICGSYSWFKDGQRLDKSKQPYNKGQLWLPNPQSSNTGWYTCQISNPCGSVNTSAYLHIIGSPVQPVVPFNRLTTATTTRAPVMVAPAEPTLTIFSPSEVVVSWEPVTAGVAVQFYKIQLKNMDGVDQTWQTVDGTMDGAESTSYKVAKLQPGGLYRIRIGAIYVNDDSKVGPSAKIRMPSSSAKPSTSPTIVSAVQQGNGIMLVSWTYHSKTPVTNFVVQYQVASRIQTARWQETVVEAITRREMETNSVRLKDLEDNQWYVIQVLAQNAYGRGRPGNAFRRQVVYPFAPSGTSDGGSAETSNVGSNADETYINPTKTGLGSDNDLLYIILGAVLGSMVLLLIIFVAICGFKQRQQRRAMLSMSNRSQNKFADASKVLYGEQLKQQQQPVNGVPTQYITLNGGNGGVHSPYNDTISSMNSQRMSLNINPMNELDENFTQNTMPNGDLHEPREQNKSLDYNLMQHYPHYNSNGSRTTPTYHHDSHQSIEAGSQRDGSTHYSHGSLPHYNVHQQYDPVRSTTPQFSTFLPRPANESGPLPTAGKLPHPQGLRPVQYAHSPASSACEGSQNSQQRRRRKKRSQHNRDHMIHQSNSNAGSAKEYNTNTDLSSGEGTGVEEYNQMLPPPPMLPSSYGKPQAADTLDSNTERI